MVRRCVWGTCNSDERYPERLIGVRLIPFPQPKQDQEKCLRWIKACGRPHHQLNVNNIDGNRNKVVCSKHFIGENRPTQSYPDPIPACGGTCTPSRPLPNKRKACKSSKPTPKEKKQKLEEVFLDKENSDPQELNETECSGTFEQSTQTSERFVSPLEFLSMTAEVQSLKLKVQEQENIISDLKKQQIKEVKTEQFGVNHVLNNKTNHKNLFKHYAGITYVRFLALLSFLIPDNFTLSYEKGRSDLKNLSNDDGLFLTLIRCRRDFSLADLATKFGLKIQSAGVVFNTWIDHMYFKFGQLSIWPHRETIIKNMPSKFKKDFPNTLIIIDGTEMKTQTPCALGLQSQFYSDYKGSITLKCLIGCDPRGSVMFISELFTGSISDKALTKDSGFLELLEILKDCGHILNGDAVMADKGFTIEEELNKLNIKLNIPPFIKEGKQMTSGEIKMTQKIAKHRIHIERLIAKIKKFLIVKHDIPTSMFSKINKIWSICCFLTLFQDTFVKDKH
ncbi:uncharacterized protein LOC134255348 [Saccostrea cucullata]|uniref:uncharacterized protein LOC134246707 n=1 Tax=Saccostrea cuccullata TaxID=36930 RepID=UPI002ED2F8C8